MSIERRKIPAKAKKDKSPSPSVTQSEANSGSDATQQTTPSAEEALFSPSSKDTDSAITTLSDVSVQKVEAPEGRGWKIALDIVNSFRPVPRLLWSMIHGVYGRAGEIGRPDAMLFSPVSPLILSAAKDRTFLPGAAAQEVENMSISDAIEAIGVDVVGSLCFVHSICRRISKVLSERVSRPILDDALLRAHIGFYVGKFSKNCSAGAGMLAGFSGRSGLAIQMAWGNDTQAQKALTGLASGENMSEVCAKVYGCDPLEIAALALIYGGCSRDIAFGISAYNLSNRQLYPGSEQYRWLTMFSVIEELRMGRWENVSDQDWAEIGYTTETKTRLMEQVEQIQRRGHGWNWMTQAQL